MNKMELKKKAAEMPQETIERLQEFLDGKRKLGMDELTDGSLDSLLLFHELVQQGRLTLPEDSSKKCGFHKIWSSWVQQEYRKTDEWRDGRDISKFNN